MIRCQVIEQFTLSEFNKLQNIVRKNVSRYGELYVGDKFECDNEMAKYLSGGNEKKKVVIKILEILPIDKKKTK